MYTVEARGSMMSEQEAVVEIFTDGACSGNPGPGGWGAVLRYNHHEKEISGYEALTTNNRMELTAAIKALEALKRPSPSPSPVHVYTDSKYVCYGITTWIKKWRINGWKISKRELIKNVDLWQHLDSLCASRSIEWHWVKGHAGHIENERADALARNAIIAAMMDAKMSYTQSK